jgi:hypothetical protein
VAIQCLLEGSLRAQGQGSVRLRFAATITIDITINEERLASGIKPRKQSLTGNASLPCLREAGFHGG